MLVGIVNDCNGKMRVLNNTQDEIVKFRRNVVIGESELLLEQRAARGGGQRPEPLTTHSELRVWCLRPGQTDRIGDIIRAPAKFQAFSGRR